MPTLSICMNPAVTLMLLTLVVAEVWAKPALVASYPAGRTTPAKMPGLLIMLILPMEAGPGLTNFG